AMDSGASLGGSGAPSSGDRLVGVDASQISQLSDSGMVAEPATAVPVKRRYRGAILIAIVALLAGLSGALLFARGRPAPPPPLPVTASLAPPESASTPANVAPVASPPSAASASASAAPQA